MVYTYDDYLPSAEELTVKELELTSSVLKSGALYFGQYCDNQCKEFMLCKQELKDPRKCLNEGKEVTSCAFEFFKKVKKNCYGEFAKYSQCIDHSGMRMDFKNCRKQQKVLDACLKEKIGIGRPEVGYFSMVRVHHTERPKPPPESDDWKPDYPVPPHPKPYGFQ